MNMAHNEDDDLRKGEPGKPCEVVLRARCLTKVQQGLVKVRAQFKAVKTWREADGS